MPEQTPAQSLLPRATRVYIYQIVAATAPLLVGIGIITEGVAQNLLAIFGALLTIGASGLALKNVSGS